jgi:hypothetical protein
MVCLLCCFVGRLGRWRLRTLALTEFIARPFSAVACTGSLHKTCREFGIVFAIAFGLFVASCLDWTLARGGARDCIKNICLCMWFNGLALASGERRWPTGVERSRTDMH